MSGDCATCPFMSTSQPVKKRATAPSSSKNTAAKSTSAIPAKKKATVSKGATVSAAAKSKVNAINVTTRKVAAGKDKKPQIAVPKTVSKTTKAVVSKAKNVTVTETIAIKKSYQTRKVTAKK